MRILLGSLIIFNVTMLYLVIASLGYFMNIYLIFLFAFVSGVSILGMVLGLILVLISKHKLRPNKRTVEQF